ncbi:hypothetical protein H257_07310 [Aphanomyces astaci]|uniref:Uncharacterized protein n=1 Tax=Aphanomyces astaci TaxID=112090 RepID=W4GHQ7_APHAT|nr:hypothetical protein H257_07310 [Aphanomyces astaci]ETV79245.1 hypothetical protein H257_07310 [Aphanomyces astaci]|eukprot:XP_009831086.1 hypothetical protein H257_07310 [Aphanomyces astaci]
MLTDTTVVDLGYLVAKATCNQLPSLQQLAVRYHFGIQGDWLGCKTVIMCDGVPVAKMPKGYALTLEQRGSIVAFRKAKLTIPRIADEVGVCPKELFAAT